MSDARNPERSLWANVLLVMIDDALIGPHDGRNREHRQLLCQEARDYLTTPSQDLIEVCSLAGIEVEPLIERMVERIAAAPSPEELTSKRRQRSNSFHKTTAKPKRKRTAFPDRLFTINGITRTAQEWCDRFDIPLQLAKGRIAASWTPERAFTLTTAQAREEQRRTSRDGFTYLQASAAIKDQRLTSRRTTRRPPVAAQLHEHDGLRLSIREWSDRTGINVNTIRKRLHDGWTFADAVSCPVRPKAA